MTNIYNREDLKQTRKDLRNNMPTAEVYLWCKLKGRQFKGHKFRRQHSVGRYVLDFYYPQLKLGIELDGDSHFQDGAKEYDRKRQEFIESFGIRIVRFLNTDIYDNMDGVMEVLASVVEERERLKRPE